MISPTELQIEIENKCPLNCKHCSSSSLKNEKQRGYSVNAILDLLKVFEGPLTINLTGGDPQLLNDLNGLLRKLKNQTKELEIGLFTSGITFEDGLLSPITLEKTLKQKEMGLSTCYISIYHNNPTLHDYITNTKKSFYYTERSIKNYIKTGINIKSHIPITRHNIDHLDDITQHLANLGVTEVRLLKLSPKGNAIKFWKDICPSVAKLNQLLERIKSEKVNKSIRLSIAGFPDIMPCRPFENSYKCQAGINLFYITYSGNIYPCACTKGDLQHCIGHITEPEKIDSYIKNTKHLYYNDCFNKTKEELPITHLST